MRYTLRKLTQILKNGSLEEETSGKASFFELRAVAFEEGNSKQIRGNTAVFTEEADHFFPKRSHLHFHFEHDVFSPTKMGHHSLFRSKSSKSLGRKKSLRSQSLPIPFSALKIFNTCQVILIQFATFSSSPKSWVGPPTTFEFGPTFSRHHPKKVMTCITTCSPQGDVKKSKAMGVTRVINQRTPFRCKL